MKFEEYVEQCGDVGEEFWKNWIIENIELTIAIKSDYDGVQQRHTWAVKNCRGAVLFYGSWALFQFEEDSVLYTLKWL